MMISNAVVSKVFSVYKICELEREPLANTRVADTSTTAQCVAVPCAVIVPPEIALTSTARPPPMASFGALIVGVALAKLFPVTVA